MATIQGSGGNASINGYVAKFDNWSGNIVNADVDTTGFGDTWTTCAPVQRSLNGSVSGTLEYGAAGTAPFATSAAAATAAMVLTADTGKTFTFNGVLSRISLDRPHAGKAGITFDFQSSGTITEAWS